MTQATTNESARGQSSLSFVVEEQESRPYGVQIVPQHDPVRDLVRRGALSGTARLVVDIDGRLTVEDDTIALEAWRAHRVRLDRRVVTLSNPRPG